MAPAPIGRAVIDPWWRRRRAALFSRYDAMVCAPGPYLAEYDLRAKSALCDIAVGAERGLRVVLSSHSIGPLQPAGLAEVGKATLRVAREPATFDYLRRHGMSSVLAADYAFIYPYAAIRGPSPVTPPYRLAFLRSNNLDAARLRMEGGALFEGSTPIAGAANEPLVLATSDRRRDGRFLARAARVLGVPSFACRSVEELVLLIGGSSGVLSDRYHPAICAAALGKPAQVLLNREPHKMQGLKDLLAGRTLEESQALARAGLAAVTGALRNPS
jgi:hypothetical protein